jgi:ABC-type sugar transport system ATPase subunit
MVKMERAMKTSESMVINTHGLSKTYKGVTALQSLDLKVARHSIPAPI